MTTRIHPALASPRIKHDDRRVLRRRILLGRIARRAIALVLKLPQVATRILIERIVSRRGGRAPIANRLHHTTTAVEFPRGAPSLWRLLLRQVLLLLLYGEGLQTSRQRDALLCQTLLQLLHTLKIATNLIRRERGAILIHHAG